MLAGGCTRQGQSTRRGLSSSPTKWNTSTTWSVDRASWLSSSSSWQRWCHLRPSRPPCDILPRIWARPGFLRLSGAGTGLSRSPAPRKRNATTQTTHTALRRGSCCTLCSRLRPQLRRWKAASEAPQRGRGRRMRFCYSQLELAALQEVGGDAQKNDILPGRPRQSSPWTRQRSTASQSV